MNTLSWRIWPVIAAALAILFIAVDLLLVGKARTVQTRIGHEIHLLSELSGLNDGINQLALVHRVDLNTAAGQLTDSGNRWPDEIQRFTDRVHRVGQRFNDEPGVQSMVDGMPTLLNDIDSLHSVVAERSIAEAGARLPESVFQFMLQRAAKRIEGAERKVHEQGLGMHTALLSQRWDQAQVLLFLSCFMAFVFALLVGMSRRLLVESRRAGKDLMGAKQQLEHTNKELRETMLSKEEKEVMIKEIHHRVKNNLQIVKSLIRFQQDQVNDAKTRELFNECITRVSAMALVHEQTYLSKDLANIDVSSYLDHLVRDLVHAYSVDKKLKMDIDIRVKTLGVDTLVPLGLMINEIISNSFKYAFQGRESGTIIVHLHGSESDGLHMHIGDDGVGLKSRDGFHRPNSLGMDLIHTLAGQLDSDISLVDGPGTRYEVVSQKLSRRKVA
ncbi:MAG: sensor histidine kinase [Flavobacteriales bacterium]